MASCFSRRVLATSASTTAQAASRGFCTSTTRAAARPNALTRAAALSLSAARRPLSAPASTTKAIPTIFAPRRLYSTPTTSSSSSSSSSSTPPPPPPPPPPKVKFWPFFLIIGLGFGGYVLLVNQRKNMPENIAKANAPAKAPTAFSADDVTVVFVLGGPGAGKGTQCARLVDQYGFCHLSAGDLLRAEQNRPGSQFGQLIKDCIRDGAIVPMEVTVKLLENAMADSISKNPTAKQHRFLIDGFPRKMDQAVAFEETVCPAKLVLFFDCPEAEMERRLLERGKTSGRADDNAESIRKRFKTFEETSMPVVDSFAERGLVVKIDSTVSPDAVFKDTQSKLTERLSL